VEWQEADEALNLLGEASVSLVQSALKEYLDGCLFVHPKRRTATKKQGEFVCRLPEVFQ